MIQRNISLKKYNTFGLDYSADTFFTPENEEEVISFVTNNRLTDGQCHILGGGSNILFAGDYHGTIIHPLIYGIEVIKEKGEEVLISAGAGVIWDDLVRWSVERGYSGLENLSMIPGTVGATPVQNIGAYGAEVKDYISKVRSIDLTDGSVTEFSSGECKFGYRDSIFKKELKGKYLIVKVWFSLSLNPVVNLEYGSLKEEAQKLGTISTDTVRQAVINIRKAKLPDPSLTGNAGSFFKNPVVSVTVADELRKVYPSAPVYRDMSGDYKIAAGWLIDKCGWKGKRKGNAGVHDRQALVLVNYGKASGNEILELSEEIRKSVLDKFRIELDREVEII